MSWDKLFRSQSWWDDSRKSWYWRCVTKLSNFNNLSSSSSKSKLRNKGLCLPLKNQWKQSKSKRSDFILLLIKHTLFHVNWTEFWPYAWLTAAAIIWYWSLSTDYCNRSTTLTIRHCHLVYQTVSRLTKNESMLLYCNSVHHHRFFPHKWYRSTLSLPIWHLIDTVVPMYANDVLWRLR